MDVKSIVKLKNPNGDDICVGIVEGKADGKVKVVYFPSTSPAEHGTFDESELS